MTHILNYTYPGLGHSWMKANALTAKSMGTKLMSSFYSSQT